MKEKKEEMYSVGLDIGNSKICAVAGKKGVDGQISILHYAEERYDADYESMAKGLSLNSQNLNQTASRVLQKLANNSDLEIGSVNCNYSNENISLKSFKTEITNGGNKFTVTKSELSNLVRSAKEQVKKNSKDDCLHPLPTDFYIDKTKIGKYPEGVTGNILTGNFNLILSPKEIVNSYVDSLENLKYGFLEKDSHAVTINQLVYSPIADAASTLSIEDKQNGILLINLGSQLTEVTVFKEYGLRHTYVLGLGSQAILKDMSQAFNITEHQAEQIFMVSCEKPSREIEINEVIELAGRDGLPTKQLLLKSVVLVIESRIKEIVSLLVTNIIESGYAKGLGNGIILAGAVARMDLVRLIFEQSFNPLTVRIAESTRNIDQNSFLELSHPKYATAVGLMLSSLRPFDERLPIPNILKEPREPSIGDRIKDTVFGKFLGKFEDPELRQTYN